MREAPLVPLGMAAGKGKIVPVCHWGSREPEGWAELAGGDALCWAQTNSKGLRSLRGDRDRWWREKELNSCCLMWHWRHRDPGQSAAEVGIVLSASPSQLGAVTTGLVSAQPHSWYLFVFVAAPKGSSGITLRALTTPVKKLSTVTKQELMKTVEKVCACTHRTMYTHPGSWHREKVFTRNGSFYYTSYIHRDKSMMPFVFLVDLFHN